MRCNGTAPKGCNRYTRSHPTGLKYNAYTFLPFGGLYGEDGTTFRGPAAERESAVVKQNHFGGRFVPVTKQSDCVI